MTIAYYCVFVAALLPYLWVAYAKSTSDYIRGGNRSPREYGAQLEGARKRAYWAQQNSFEAFPIFAAIIIIAHLVGHGGAVIDWLSVAFVLCRIAHGILYIVGQATLRSVAWTGGALVQAVIVVSLII